MPPSRQWQLEQALKDAAQDLFEALSMGKETRAIDIVRKSRLNFPRDWHKIMNIMPSLCGVPSRPSFVDNSSTSRRSYYIEIITLSLEQPRCPYRI